MFKAYVMIKKAEKLICRPAAVLLLLLAGGCSSMLSSNLLEPLSASLKKQTDLQLLYDGAPSLLLMIDGFIASDPENEQLLITGIQAYASYASTVSALGEKNRAAELGEKTKSYALALLRRSPAFKQNIPTSLDEFSKALQNSYSEKNIASLFWTAAGWATWIRYQNGSPEAIADLPRVEQMMLRVLQIDETFYYGGAHIFLGAYYGSRPEIYGGRPDKSREHFERALAIGQRQFLLAQVAYADSYARMTFDRELFASLLKEVIEQPTAFDELAAANTLAKQMAGTLLNSIDEIF